MKARLAELHVHLRGTIHPRLFYRLAERHGMRSDIPFFSDTYSWTNFAEFMESYHRVAQAVKTPEDYTEITADYLCRSAAQGTIYCELMVSPDHAADIGIEYDALVGAVAAGICYARARTGIESRVVVTCVRHRGPDLATSLAELAVAKPHPLVVGFGMAGNEQSFRPRDFEDAFKIARRGGLATTCHVGEFCGPDSVWEALEYLNLDRLGHGVRCADDPLLMKHLVESGVPLEICPTSNLKLGVYETADAHPFLRMLRSGCEVTLNTDDPAHFNGSLENEYWDAKKNFSLTDKELQKITSTAIRHAFCDVDTKATLSKLLVGPPSD